MTKREKSFELPGLTPAAFTPLKANGAIDLDRIPSYVDFLLSDGVSALYVLGSTGEGVSLTSQERRSVAEAYVTAADGRLPIVVQVGHNSLAEARALAAHAQAIGADAISATPPTYFKPQGAEQLITCLKEITSGAPDLPFYYYNIPMKTGVEIDLDAFTSLAALHLPSLVGIKFSDSRIFQLPTQTDFDFLFGVDEMLLSALSSGMKGAIGSTYNFAAPLYLRIIKSVEKGAMDEARLLQSKSVQMINTILSTCGQPGLKAMMSLIGQDCGPHRLPIVTAKKEDIEAMKLELEDIGFFEWGRMK